jgi:hypothetical protein
MKKLIWILFIAPFWFACGDDKPVTDPVKDSLTAETNRLNGITSDQAASLDSFFRAMNDIQANLDEIKAKEKLIANDTAKKGDLGSRKQQITADIQAIYDMMVQNKQRLATAKANLKNSNLQIASMQTTIDQLNNTLITREAEITELKDDLEKRNLELSNLSMSYQEVQQESDAKTTMLNTAYYAYGTKKELESQGVITLEGGVIGLGKTIKMNEKPNTDYFTQVDITTLNEIPLSSKEATVVTTHPAGSYRIEGTDGRADKLVITDQAKFWSVSKYLVVVVK